MRAWSFHGKRAISEFKLLLLLLDLKKIQALSGIRTHDLCDAGAVLSQLSYQSHMRAVVYGLALYMGTFWLGPSTVKMKEICPIVVFNDRICIYYRYHSIATMGQISFIFTVLGPSQNVPI